MAQSFYSSVAYKRLQSEKARNAWKLRLIIFPHRRKSRTCVRPLCGVTFIVPPADPKKFCSQSCAAQYSNKIRGKRSQSTKEKIAKSLKGRPSPWKGVIKVQRLEVICKNPSCRKKLLVERWKDTQFCSIKCAMSVIGGRPTSHKASRGKAGIRPDISATIYFYSRWEANIARLYTYLGVLWRYAPRTFDIGGQMYTPDFYLPETDTYVEVKNFWWKYSKERDEKFRKRYKNIRLDVILKDEYLKLEKKYAHLIPKWEYRNSRFEKI